MHDDEIPYCTRIEEISNSKCYYALYNNIPVVVKKYHDFIIFQNDLDVHEALMKQSGIVPRVVYSCFPYIFYERIDGISVAQKPQVLEDIQNLELLVDAVKSIHTYVYDDSMDWSIQIEKDMQQRYENISTSVLNNQQRQVIYVLKELSNQHSGRLGFIHGDLDASNVMFAKDQIYLIDWEKSRVADISWDLSALLVWGMVFSSSFFYYIVRYIIDNEGLGGLWKAMYKAVLSICEKAECISPENKKIVDRMLGRVFGFCSKIIKEYASVSIIDI